MIEAPFEVQFGQSEHARLRLSILGYEHPEVAEPEGLDVVRAHFLVDAGSVSATFEGRLFGYELQELCEYLSLIISGNGPAKSMTFGGGVFELAFAPSRRGPMLLVVTIKEIDETHLRLEYMVRLEPHEIVQIHRELSAAFA